MQQVKKSPAAAAEDSDSHIHMDVIFMLNSQFNRNLDTKESVICNRILTCTDAMQYVNQDLSLEE